MKESVTGAVVANWVRMVRQEHVGAILLVEGDTDARLYSRVIDRSSCVVINANEKQNVLDALEILDGERFAGIVGIVDADFDRLTTKSLISNNLLLTDTHDLETLLLTSPSLENVLSSYSSRVRLDRLNKPVREIMIDSAMPFGYLRWISEREGLSLDFKELKYSRYIDIKTLEVDISRLVVAILSRSGKKGIDPNSVLKSISELHKERYDPWQICCGHDLIQILSIGLRNKLGTHKAQQVHPEILEKALYIGYEPVYFSYTNLCQLIKAWEQVNKNFTILPQ